MRAEPGIDDAIRVLVAAREEREVDDVDFRNDSPEPFRAAEIDVDLPGPYLVHAFEGAAELAAGEVVDRHLAVREPTELGVHDLHADARGMAGGEMPARAQGHLLRRRDGHGCEREARRKRRHSETTKAPS